MNAVSFRGILLLILLALAAPVAAHDCACESDTQSLVPASSSSFSADPLGALGLSFSTQGAQPAVPWHENPWVAASNLTLALCFLSLLLGWRLKVEETRRKNEHVTARSSSLRY